MASFGVGGWELTMYNLVFVRLLVCVDVWVIVHVLFKCLSIRERFIKHDLAICSHFGLIGSSRNKKTYIYIYIHIYIYIYVWSVNRRKWYTNSI